MDLLAREGCGANIKDPYYVILTIYLYYGILHQNQQGKARQCGLIAI
jgi:hypothetical protein